MSANFSSSTTTLELNICFNFIVITKRCDFGLIEVLLRGYLCLLATVPGRANVSLARCAVKNTVVKNNSNAQFIPAIIRAL